jgi:hypothetical protein
MLDEYVERELDEKSAVQVSTHLTGCAGCAGEYEMLRRELQTYSQYLPHIEATPMLWANVQAEVEKAQRERFSLSNFPEWIAKTFGKSTFNPAFAATSLVLLITFGIIVGLIKYNLSENTFNEKTVSQKTDVQSSSAKTDTDTKNEISSNDKKRNISKTEDKITIARVVNRVKRNISRSVLSKPKNQFVNVKLTNPNPKPTNEEVVEKAERQYLSAIAVLSRDLERQRARLSPNLISQLEQSLADIDRTINETRRAVSTQPNDAVAVQYMTTAYAKKVELLRAITGN